MPRYFLNAHRISDAILSVVLMGLLQAWLLAQSGAASSLAPRTTLDEVSEKLSCRCGCNLVLNRCNHVQCGSALPMRARINKEIAEGKTRDEIVAGFVRDMGEQVLAVPPTSGFNWNAWIMPFAVLTVGSVLLAVALKMMLRRRAMTTTAAPAVAAAGTSSEKSRAKPSSVETEDRVEKELKEFEG